jgi:hypothetical protein
VEYSDKELESIGWTSQNLAGVFQQSGTHMNITVITKESLALAFRLYTEMKEIEPGLFLAQEESRETPERLIDLR